MHDLLHASLLVLPIRSISDVLPLLFLDPTSGTSTANRRKFKNLEHQEVDPLDSKIQRINGIVDIGNSFRERSDWTIQGFTYAEGKANFIGPKRQRQAY